ncbi:MAG TPA: adenosylcobinamide-GDP ribazoletransferase [Polaromonas sp.]|uniref:adenosylcobinamide-GDP ribazoletransferase n=1 Tax=Polaromonas sp. TaxID=1869339 RepID=UPI002D4EC561|nr:adenosylcobinamide-GDP ribazoletransferase [Polaromonas sp.]HYW56106.1 adenosylcobinamide-GDP ribazoletransferase [Polaromonas sp.]
MQSIRHFLLAVQFFTRIPITGRLADWVGFSPEMLRASAAHFPGIGWIVGAVTAGTYLLLLALLPATTFTPLVAAVLSTVTGVLLTGAFHEDGLADVADGLGGSAERDRALEIMKDSRVGAFGAIALVLALVSKLALLGLLGSLEGAVPQEEDAPVLFNGWLVATALFAAHVASRALPLLLIYSLPHVGDSANSKSKPLAAQISPNSLFIAAVWCLGALALSSWALPAITLIVAFSFSVIALLWMGRLFTRRLQGFTGDCLGATQQVCEIAFYLGLALSFP